MGTFSGSPNYFEGVPEILVPDNLKSGVKKPCYYKPEINPTYLEMAQHYGCAVIPARVRKPRDKAPAEKEVQDVERWIIAKLRNQTFFSLYELKQAVRFLLEEANNRPFQKREGSRRTLFESIEKPMLKALPVSGYEFAIECFRIKFHTSLSFMIIFAVQTTVAGRRTKMLEKQLTERLSQMRLKGLLNAHLRQQDDVSVKELSFEERFNTGSTIIASQLPIEHWTNALAEPTLADAILDRIVHNAHKISLKGESMRKVKSTIQSDLTES